MNAQRTHARTTHARTHNMYAQRTQAQGTHARNAHSRTMPARTYNSRTTPALDVRGPPNLLPHFRAQFTAIYSDISRHTLYYRHDGSRGRGVAPPLAASEVLKQGGRGRAEVGQRTAAGSPERRALCGLCDSEDMNADHSHDTCPQEILPPVPSGGPRGGKLPCPNKMCCRALGIIFGGRLAHVKGWVRLKWLPVVCMTESASAQETAGRRADRPQGTHYTRQFCLFACLLACLFVCMVVCLVLFCIYVCFSGRTLAAG